MMIKERIVSLRGLCITMQWHTIVSSQQKGHYIHYKTNRPNHLKLEAGFVSVQNGNLQKYIQHFHLTRAFFLPLEAV